MKLTVVLAVLSGILVLACSNAALAPVEPTPIIDATVEARVNQELDPSPNIDATVEARVQATSEAAAATQATADLLEEFNRVERA